MVTSTLLEIWKLFQKSLGKRYLTVLKNSSSGQVFEHGWLGNPAMQEIYNTDVECSTPGSTVKPGFHQRCKCKRKHKSTYFTVKTGSTQAHTSTRIKIFPFSCVHVMLVKKGSFYLAKYLLCLCLHSLFFNEFTTM
jgi:hypothetical protein